MEEIAKYIVVTILVTGLIWGFGKLVADNISDVKVINPEPGIKCVVVSRMFNTSVDCWKDGNK